MLVSVRNIAKSYERSGQEPVKVLEKVNMEINAGEFISIVGPSGCGKTTLLNLIGCLLKPSAGEVSIAGIDANKMGERQLAQLRNEKIGFIFQGSHLIPYLNVFDNVLAPTYFSRGKGQARKLKLPRALELIEELGLSDRINHLPYQLSLGQRRRVAIARALINDPLILLADEPTNDLDPERSAQIADILSSLNIKGLTLLIVTHQPELAARAKRQYQMHNGVLAAL
ncbi:MAG: ABC transporter ATP-binding protein [Thermincola sp.]|nr:ABC transporter ATP-binding protein [Thermincola sp.]MDT3702269.1 ABC transporter ATP-binding protein [Thermincola sp.]